MSRTQSNLSPVQQATPIPSQSRRDTASSSSSSRTPRTNAHPAVESAVTRLLVSIKQLLEALTKWSQLTMDETDVSNVYVRLGNDFNAAVSAFSAFGIDMTELMTVPDDLRNVLEQCLAEDANVDNLNLYLPTVRQIITNLLQGLRGKQSIYRRIVSDHKHRSEASGHERTESRSSRSDRSSRRDTSRTDTSHRSQQPTTRLADEGDRRESLSRRSAQQSSRRREQSQPRVNGNGPPQANGDESFVGGFSPTLTQRPQLLPEEGPSSDGSNSFDAQYRRTSPPPVPPAPVETPAPPPPQPPPSIQQTLEQEVPREVPSTPPVENAALSPQMVPASIKRWSLVDKPVPPNVVVEPSSPDPEHLRNGSSTPPPPDTPPIESSRAPAMANSLAALKKSDTLERRASKRFSTYNISKMTGSTSKERTARTPGSTNRRSLAVSSALTPGELAVLTEVDDEEPPVATPSPRREGSRTRRTVARSATPDEREQDAPPVPPLPSTPARTPEPVLSPAETPSARPTTPVVVHDAPTPPPSKPNKLTVFLQLGREVKKVTIEPGLSFSSLRVLFVDKFSYNPGLDNFPAIYIRDPSSGVQYELEDMDEVKEKCLLSLNIEPLDQIKQHIDAQISTLSQDLKDLRVAVSNNNRQSLHIIPNSMNMNVSSPLAESTPIATRPTDRQFQQVARRLSRFAGNSTSTPSPFLPSSSSSSSTATITHSQIQPQMTGQSLQPQMTGGSLMSDYSSRVVTDLKTQFDEVQNLRRDLGIMRQLYTEFMKQTKESLGTLRTQTQSVKQLANTNVGGARAYIDSGKNKLDVRSQNVLTEVEKLQDTVEGIKDDVLKRHVTPKAQFLRAAKKDMDSVAGELESLKEHIMTIKPMWKKTWEEELQNIVEEQQFLTHQEEFLSDLLEDHKAVVEVYGHVEQVIGLRGSGSGKLASRNRGFKPPPLPEEGGGGISNVMLEIRGANVDPERRLKAIEANQKNRQKELASRSDEFQAEITEFVGQKKLKMTGGAEEAERVRQRRNDLTLKAMFTGGSSADVALGSPDYSGSPTRE